MNPEGNLINAIKNEILSKIPTSEDWAEAIGVSLVSLFSHNAKVYTEAGPLKLNVWYIYIGPSGIAYKTLPLKNYVLPLLQKVKEETGEDYLLPSSFSMEGMVEYLSSKNNKGIILKDEVTLLFKDLEKTYGKDALEFLSQLYDGFIQKRYTRKVKHEEVKDLYVNFLGTATPYIYHLLPEDFFIQGLGNRILFVMWDNKVKQVEPTFFEPNLENGFQISNQLIEKLISLKDIELAVPAKTEPLAKFANKCNELSLKYNNKGLYVQASYVQRLYTHALKLAAIKAIAKSVGKISSEKPVPILEEDIKWAITKAVKHWKNFQELLKQWEEFRTKKPSYVEDISFKVETVIAKIKEHGGKITRSDLMNALRWSRKELDKVIEWLVEADRLEIVREKTATKPKVVYVLKQ